MNFYEKRKLVLAEFRKAFPKAKIMSCSKNNGRNDSLYFYMKVPFPKPALTVQQWNNRVRYLRKVLSPFGVTNKELPMVPHELFDDGSGYCFIAFLK